MKIGLCLAGGGARGAYQIGVCKALQELGVFSLISAFSGTSIGAVNAAFLATTPLKNIIDIWESTHASDLKKTESFFSRIRKEKFSIMDHGLFEITSLEDLLHQNLPVKALLSKEVYVTLSESGEVHSGLFGLFKASYEHFFKKDSKVIYSLLSEQETEDIIPLILASCSIPIAFPAVQLEDKQYYDGGMYDNVPVEPLVQAGCDKILVIHLQRFDYAHPEKYPSTDILEIKHKGSLGGILHFEANQATKLIEYGYVDGHLMAESILNFIESKSISH